MGVDYMCVCQRGCGLCVCVSVGVDYMCVCQRGCGLYVCLYTGRVSVGVAQQWTDKYSPAHSCHFISNTKAVKKLHGWLAEWKRRTDLEIRRCIKAEMQRARRAGKSREEIKKSACTSSCIFI